MRGAPQEGFSLHILQISARTSGEMMGRPGWPQSRDAGTKCRVVTLPTDSKPPLSRTNNLNP
jgi:hypothetical protein